MASVSTTTTTAAVLIPEIWTGKTVKAIRFAAVLLKTVDTHFEADLPYGDTINIPLTVNPSVATKAQAYATPIEFQAHTLNWQQVTVSTYIAGGVLVERPVEKQSKYDVVAIYTDGLGYRLGNNLEAAITAEYDNFPTASDVGSLTSEATHDDYITIMTNLDTYACPYPRYLVVGSKAHGALLKLDPVVHADYQGAVTAGRVGATGMVGHFMGYDVVVSLNVVASGAGHLCGAYNPGNIIMIVQDKPNTKTD